MSEANDKTVLVAMLAFMVVLFVTAAVTLSQSATTPWLTTVLPRAAADVIAWRIGQLVGYIVVIGGIALFAYSREFEKTARVFHIFLLLATSKKAQRRNPQGSTPPTP